MKIKQQKQIKTFLIEEFGKDRGSALFDEQEKSTQHNYQNTKTNQKSDENALLAQSLPALHCTRFCQKRFYGRCRIQAYAKIYA